MWYSGFLYELTTYIKPVTHTLCIHIYTDWLLHVYIRKCDLIGTLKQLHTYFPLAVCVCMAHVSTAAVFGAGHGHCMYVLYSLHTNDRHV